MNTQKQQRPEDHPMFPVVMAAIHQAMFGKGQRHGGATVPWLDQPIFHYARMHGRGFLTGQAAKKLEEAASTRDGEAFITEVLGAIVYASAAVIREQQIAEEKGRDKLVLAAFDHLPRDFMGRVTFGSPDAARKADQVATGREQKAVQFHDGPGGLQPVISACQDSTTERSWNTYAQGRNQQLGAIERRDCENCHYKDVEHTDDPCRVCSAQPEVLPFWKKPDPNALAAARANAGY